MMIDWFVWFADWRPRHSIAVHIWRGTTLARLIIICWPVMVVRATLQHCIDTPGHRHIFIGMFVLDLYGAYVIEDLRI